MKKKSKTHMYGILLSAISLCGVCRADEINVSVEGFLQLPDSVTNTVSVSTLPLNAGCPLPESGYPAYWFDCTQTNGWEFTEDGHVAKIPSLSGSRYLTTTEFTSWTGWSNGAMPPLPPEYLESDDTLGGMPALDFGELGSMCAMMFDPYEYPSGAKTNILHNIGSIVAVWGSQNSGGWILGGGPDTWTGNDGASYAWHRGYSYEIGNNQFSYDSSLFYGWGYAPPFNKGARHDGMLTDPYAMGFNRAWEVIVLPAQNATASASGLGLGDTRTSQYWYSGGMKVAELMVFDRVLTMEEIVSLEVWLQKKWFGRTMEGHGGNARISRLLARTAGNGSATRLDVPAGETLTIGKLDGIRGVGASVEKKGEGTLVLKDASGFAGDLKLAGGKLSFTKRAIPLLSALPERYLHFDATKASSMETVEREGAEYLKRWSDLAGGKVTRKNVFLAQDTEGNQPSLIRNALGDGLHMVDFRSVADGACLRFRKGTAEAPEDATLGSISTVIAVVGAQRGGGRVALLGHDAFHRAVSDYNASTYSSLLPLLNTRTLNSGMGLSATNGVAWIDGLKKGKSDGYDTPGYQVVALKVPGGDVKWFGAANDGTAAGGFRVGEVFIYNRLLTDREIEDIQAYLMNRWFGREAPGYAKTSVRASVPDVQRLDVVEDSMLEADDGMAVRIGRLNPVAPLAISGAGEVLVESSTATGRVALSGTVLKTINPPATELSELAAGALLHLDVSNAGSIETVAENGTNFVTRWHSKDFRNAAYQVGRYASYRPWLNAEKAVSGHAVMDFGGPISQGAFLMLEKPLDSIRDVFVVLDGEKGGGFLFGSRGGMVSNAGDTPPNHSCGPAPEVTGDFFPDIWTSPIQLLTGLYSPVFTSGGSVCSNGIAVKPTSTPFPTVATLMEYHAAGGATASWIGADKPTQNAGGFRIAELVVYDRTLSLRERVATRNHLMAKWFGALPEPLPAETHEIALGTVTGSGAIVKENDGGLSIGDIASFTGTVSVASGTLTLSRSMAEAEPRLAMDGRIAHFDAADASTVTAVEMDGYTGFSEWRSTVGEWKAVPLSKYMSEATGTARLMRNSLNSLDTFLLGDASSPMLFEDSTGLTNDISGIRTVFWVIGTVNGATGGFVLGGGSPKRNGVFDPWMGVDLRKSDPAASLLYDGIASGYVIYDNYCIWHLDGTVMSPNIQGFQTNMWHVMDMSFKDTVAISPTASGFAFDGRIMTQPNGWNDFNKYSGNQNLAEVIFYNRVLTEQERKETQAYLQIKWGLRSGKPAKAKFSIAAGAKLDLGGGTHDIPSVSGSGEIVNGTLELSKLTADASAASVPTVLAAVTLTDGASVELKNTTSSTSEIPVLNAASVTGNLKSAVFTGDEVPDDRRVRLQHTGGVLRVKILNPGFSVIFR